MALATRSAATDGSVRGIVAYPHGVSDLRGELLYNPRSHGVRSQDIRTNVSSVGLACTRNPEESNLISHRASSLVSSAQLSWEEAYSTWSATVGWLPSSHRLGCYDVRCRTWSPLRLHPPSCRTWESTHPTLRLRSRRRSDGGTHGPSRPGT